jgi:O-antigen ligase
LLFSIIFLWIFLNTDSFSSYLDINSTESTDVAVRLLMLTSSYDIFLNHRFFGIGYGMFVGHNTVPVFNTGTVPIYLSSPHNGIAAILVEFGIIGLVIFLYISGVVIKTMNEKLKKIKDQQIYRYCTSIYVVQVVLMFSVFISNSNLFGPPSEISYLYISFISWFMIGSVVGVKETME